MTITVEDGTIVANANSYVSTSTLTTFATARGVTLTTSAETLLIKAMDYIEGLSYIGVKYTSDQPLQWPRADVMIDGYYVDADTIPQLLKDGLCHCAIAIDQSNDPLQDAPRKTIREKVDTLEVEYAAGSSSVVMNIKIFNSLYKLLEGGAGQLRVNKG